MNWEFLWKIVLLFTLSAYSVLVVIVLIGGIKNLKDMLKDLSSGEENPN
ncbi:hypothetical protein ACFL6O_06000 [candidate division KSB1 bacterium]